VNTDPSRVNKSLAGNVSATTSTAETGPETNLGSGASSRLAKARSYVMMRRRAPTLVEQPKYKKNPVMAKLVVHGAKLKCSEGSTVSTLMVPPIAGTGSDEMPAATIFDSKPMANINPFGLCKSITNPQVAAATTAAMGTLTPQPCIPVIPAPWSPGASAVKLQEKAALTSDSKCLCAWAGSIEVIDPGTSVEVI